MSLDNAKNILLILSGKGGVGKSSITTQLALSLSLAGKSVGILDIDLTGPSIPRLLGIEDEKIKQAPGGWLPVEVHSAQTLEDAPPITYPQTSAASQQENGTQNGTNGSNGSAAHPRPSSPKHPTSSKQIGPVYAISLAFLLTSRSSAIVWRGPKKTAMVRQFLSDVLWPPLDYLLIDTPPGTSDEHISVVETLMKNVASTSLADGTVRGGPNLAGAVIVTTPQAVAVSDVRKEINFCAKTGVKVVGVIENMSGFVCPCCGEETKIFSKDGGRVMAEQFEVPFLGYVPVDRLWGQLVEEGKRPVYESVEEGSEEEEDESLDDQVEKMGLQDGASFSAENGADEPEPIKREPGLLVDKYRNCSLSPLFAEITRKVISTVDNDKAVMVKTNPVQ